MKRFSKYSLTCNSGLILLLATLAVAFTACVSDSSVCPEPEETPSDKVYLKFNLITLGNGGKNSQKTKAADIDGEVAGDKYENTINLEGKLTYFLFDSAQKFVADISPKSTTTLASMNIGDDKYEFYEVVSEIDKEVLSTAGATTTFYILAAANYSDWLSSSNYELPEPSEGTSISKYLQNISWCVMTKEPYTDLLRRYGDFWQDKWDYNISGKYFPLAGLQKFEVQSAMLQTTSLNAPYDISLYTGKDLNLLRTFAKIEVIDKINISGKYDPKVDGSYFGTPGNEADKDIENAALRIDKLEMLGKMNQGTLFPSFYQWDANDVCETQQVTLPTIPSSAKYLLAPVYSRTKKYGNVESWGDFYTGGDTGNETYGYPDQYATDLREDRCPVFSLYVYEYSAAASQLENVNDNQKPYLRVTLRGSSDSKDGVESLLLPTTDATTLAEYKPRYGTNSDGKTFLLTALMPKAGSTAWDNMTDNMKSSTGWYTVFINEYTYEPMYEGNNTDYGVETGGRWKEYVNQDPRRFYIKTRQKASPDGNSVYAPSKYGVSQKSMQSYYSNDADITTAIGIEWDNETLGMNMRSSYYGTSADDGRANTAQWINSKTGNISAITDADKPLWTTFLTPTAMQQVPGVSGTRAQNGPDIEEHLGTNAHKLPRLVAYAGTPAYTDPYNTSFSFNDPYGANIIEGTNISSFVEAINACMNRNRDNNGNGRIDPAELRWYVPSFGKYLRIILGAESLLSPLMSYDISSLPKLNSEKNGWGDGEVKNDYLPRYMFISSSQFNKENYATVVWGLEGLSTSSYYSTQDWSGGNSHPWDVRCIRNLGTNLNTISSGDDGVQQAYTHDSKSRTITMEYYDIASVRGNSYSGNGSNAGQMPVHLMSSQIYSNLFRGRRIVIINGDNTACESSIFQEVVSIYRGAPCLGKYCAPFFMPTRSWVANP